MEVKINKEIRDYTESIYFGLSLRQFIFSFLGCGFAVITYFLFRNYLGTEILSWICILSVIPFAIMGFVKYNGMTAEQFLITFIKNKILMPKNLTFKSNIYYVEVVKNKAIKEVKHENKRKNTKNI